jgi:hypothetical protein
MHLHFLTEDHSILLANKHSCFYRGVLPKEAPGHGVGAAMCLPVRLSTSGSDDENKGQHHLSGDVADELFGNLLVKQEP